MWSARHAGVRSSRRAPPTRAHASTPTAAGRDDGASPLADGGSGLAGRGGRGARERGLAIFVKTPGSGGEDAVAAVRGTAAEAWRAAAAVAAVAAKRRGDAVVYWAAASRPPRGAAGRLAVSRRVRGSRARGRVHAELVDGTGMGFARRRRAPGHDGRSPTRSLVRAAGRVMRSARRPRRLLALRRQSRLRSHAGSGRVQPGRHRARFARRCGRRRLARAPP